MNGIIYFKNNNLNKYEDKCITISNGNIQFGMFLINKLSTNVLSYDENTIENFYKAINNQSISMNLLYVSNIIYSIPNIYIISYDLKEKYISSLDFTCLNNPNIDLFEFNKNRETFLKNEYDRYLIESIKNNLQ